MDAWTTARPNAFVEGVGTNAPNLPEFNSARTAMKTTRLHVAVVFLTCLLAWMPLRADSISLSDASIVNSRGLLAFYYVKDIDRRLIVINELTGRRHSVRLESPVFSPFWDEEKLFVVEVSGVMREFRIERENLEAGPVENISEALVRWAEYDRHNRRLYLIETIVDNETQRVFYQLVALDFPTRSKLWSSKLEEAGLIRFTDTYVAVLGQRMLQVFDLKGSRMKSKSKTDLPDSEKLGPTPFEWTP